MTTVAEDLAQQLTYLRVASEAAAAEAKTLVAPVYNVAGYGSLAVALAATGSAKAEIYIPDDYEEEVSETVVVAADNIKITGGGTLTLADGINAPILSITADNVSIKGVSFDGNNASQTEDHDIVNVTGNNYVIEKCTFQNSYDKVITVEQDAEHGAIKGNTFTDNGLIANCNGITCKGSHAKINDNIFINHGAGHCIRTGRFETDTDQATSQVEISGNLIDTAAHVGICVELDSEHILIDGNTIKAANQAMKGENCSHIIISNNLMEDCVISTSFNFGYTSVDDLTVSNNTMLNCGGGYLLPGNCVCVGNKSINSADQGIRSAVGGNVVIASNLIVNAVETSISGRGAATTIEGNVIIEPQANPVIVVGWTDYPAGFVVKGNQVHDPDEAATAFRVYGTKVVFEGNVINGACAIGAWISASSDYYIVKNNILSDATTAVKDDALSENSVTDDNI